MGAEIKTLLESLDHTGGGSGHPNALCAQAAAVIRRIIDGENKWAWLVEAPGQNYLGTRNIAHYPEFHWTKDHNAALRFMSKGQADGAMMAIRRLCPDLFGFQFTLGDAWPTEHGWLPHCALSAASGRAPTNKEE